MENEIVHEIEKEQKKEVQQRIIEISDVKKKPQKEDILYVLRLVAPGTNLRSALDGINKIGKGALIVVENEFTSPLFDGGFKLNCRFTPQRVMELSKMDGAIILSRDMRKIMYANVLLTPDSKIPTNETGTRHKAAERTAKITGALVIAVSERKHEINVYFNSIKHTLMESEKLLRKASEQIQMLEKQRQIFDDSVSALTALELRNYHGLDHATNLIQKGRMMQLMSEELQRYVIELGKEGLMIKTRLKEILQDVENETELVIKDYTKLDLKKSRTLLKTLSYEELLDKGNILKSMAYERPFSIKPIKGWRVLSKTSLKEQEIAKIVKEALTLGRAINSPVLFYKNILGEDRGESIKEEIERLKLSREVS
mgnify:CR=1 FL=1